MKEMKYHPLSKFFPMLPDAEFEQLKESIKQIGLLEPITLYDGKILDGRNRYEACKAINVEPDYRSLDDGVDPLDLVVAANMRRRHLDEDQKVQIFFDAYGTSEAQKEPLRSKNGRFTSTALPQKDGITRRQVQNITGASEATVMRVEAIQGDEGLKEELRQGKIGASAALRKFYDKKSDAVFTEPQPTRADMFAHAPGVREMMDKLGYMVKAPIRWCDSADLGKIDPQAHTPLMIKRVDEAIASLRTFKKKLEEIRDG